MKKHSLFYEFKKGLVSENPVLVMVLGLCSTLAVSNKAINAVAMALSVFFVLFFSSLIIGIIKDLIPDQVRIPSFILVIATFVTIVDLFMRAKFPGISKALGPYIPLIVVNCIILGRQEAFVSKNPLSASLMDAIGMSLGYFWVIVLLGIVREFLGFGTVFGFRVLGSWFKPWLVMVLPPGAFLTLGVFVGVLNLIKPKGGKA